MRGRRPTLLLLALLALWATGSTAFAQRHRESSSSSEERLLMPPARKCPRHVGGRARQRGEFCSSSARCPGSELCCRYGCRRECSLPVDVNPGYCPRANPVAFHGCATNCSTDAQCGKGKKCCRWGCVSTCVNAEPAHPGVCPERNVQRRSGPCRNACKNDRDCLPSQKCCFTGCSLECLDLEKDLCTLPKETGSCALSMEYFYYNSSTRTCEPFLFSGCQGNANRFYTKEECLQVCGQTGKRGTCPACPEPPKECAVSCSRDDHCPGEELCCSCGCSHMCMLPVEAHPGYCPVPTSPGNATDCLENCTADTECGPGEKCCSHGCLTTCLPAEPVHPGTCPEKRQTGVACNDSCSDDRDCARGQKCCFSGCGLQCLDLEPDICKLPAAAGPCKAHMPMFHYSPKTKTCEVFIYGGCGGNGNRFSTVQECLWTCRYQDICKLPKDPGHGDGYKITYYYNHAMHSCEHFTFHGSGGNENQFRTREQCLNTCFYPEICKMPADPGPCLANIPMYYYDHRRKTCSPFVYGGCQGNANRFPTQKHCEQRCRNPDICVLPPETGPCNHYTSMYHYSTTEERCLPFPYGGCQGNPNRFPTLEACTETCISKDICWLPADPGHCRGYFPRFYYNPVNKTCEKFIFGGCGGNENQFETQIECLWRCRNPEICHLPKEGGPCRAALLRYYYNKATRNCELFIYGGCLGNENRFETLTECEHACKKPEICRLPADHGEGNDSIPMYSYDPIGTVCEQFTYRGRAGNPNRFATLVECQEVCKDPDVCKLPEKPGPCEGKLQRFFHNSTSRLCEGFEYGGCQGNKNRFLSQQACQLTCLGTEKPGSCPPGDPADCLVTCQKDCHCPGPKKCCGTGCGQVCKDPVKGGDVTTQPPSLQ